MLVFLGCFLYNFTRSEHLHSSLLGEVTFSSVGSGCWLGLRVGVVIEVLLLSLVVSSENKSDWLLLVLGAESSSGCFFWKSEEKKKTNLMKAFIISLGIRKKWKLAERWNIIAAIIKTNIIIKNGGALAGMAHVNWLQCHLIHQVVADLIPGQGTYWGCRFDPQWGWGMWKTINISLLSPFLSPPPSPSSL